MTIEESLTSAIAAARAGRRGEAEQLFREVLRNCPTNLAAWVWLSDIAAELPVRIHALEQAIALRPSDPLLLGRLEALRREIEPAKTPSPAALGERKTGPPVESMPYLLQKGKVQEDNGEFEAAIDTYISIITHSRSATERVDATRRIEDIRMRQEADRIQPVNPDLNLLRLTLGPVFLFVIMVFVQSGLNPMRTPLLSLLGVISVAAGSLMVAVTDMRPAHPRWVVVFGKPGSGEEPEMRQGIRLLGWALLLAPYTMFLIDAGQRLGVLQSSVLAP